MATFNEATGNLLDADVDALVNTVNTVGVMGKGIALQFKNAFPANYEAYRLACKEEAVRLGHGPAGGRVSKDEAAGRGERAHGRSEPGKDRKALQPERRERPGPPRPGRSGTRPRRAGEGPVSRHPLPVAASPPR